MPKHILVPIESSDVSYKAFSRALEIAKENHAKITLIHVVNQKIMKWGGGLSGAIIRGFDYLITKRKIPDLESIFNKMLEEAEKLNIEVYGEIVNDWYPAKGIISYAKKNNVDLIVMATRGKEESTFDDPSCLREVKEMYPPCEVLVVN